MTSIRILPLSIVSQIAAGEVIERPAFAVKELIENSLDAQATEINIEIIDSGLTKIKVTDNGIGMDREDILLSFQPHSTSKLNDDSLIGITTLGFRGEALASIAAISQLTIQSRTEKSFAGVRVVVNQGSNIEVSSIGMPVGTSVEIAGLFRSVPARRKFLKSPQTEYRRIVEVVVSEALAHPQVRFSLMHNHHETLSLPSQDLLAVIQDLLGESLATDLIPVSYADAYISLQGFVGKPSLSNASANKIWLSVNTRPVNDKSITLAVKEAFTSLMEPNLYPVAILEVKVPHELIDVNVHPRKQEIHFVDQRLVFDTVKTGIMTTLHHHDLTYGNKNGQTNTAFLVKETGSYAATLLKHTVLIDNPLAKTQFTQNDKILQIHNSYLIVQIDEGMLIVDQHAAHERVLYEQLKTKYGSQMSEIKSVKVQIPIDVAISEGQLLDEYFDTLLTLGITYKKEAATQYTILSIPELFKDRDAKNLLKSILCDIDQEIPIKMIDSQTENLIHYLACKGAIKAGDPLTQRQMHELLEQLSHCRLPYTCPHGRPTQIHIDMGELRKMFKRV